MDNQISIQSRQIKEQAVSFFIWTFFGVILVKLRGIAFIKIFSTYLGASSYGYFFFIQNNGVALASLIAFNMPVAIYRFTSEAHSKNDEQLSLTIMLTSATVCLVFAIGTNILFFVTALLQLRLFTSETYFIDLVAMGLFGTIIALDSILLEFFRSRQDKGKFLSVQTVIPYITLFSFTLKTKKKKFDLREAKRIIEFSYPGMVAIFVGSVKVVIFNLLLKELHGNEAFGIYSIALSIANLIGMFDYVISLSYPTIIMRNYDLQNYQYIQHFANKMTRIYVTVLIALVFFLSTFSPLLILIFSSSEFLDSAILIPIILFALVFQAINRLTCFGPLLEKRPKPASVFNIINNLIHLITILILTPPLGPLGAAISFLIFQAVSFTLNFQLSQSLYPINYDVSKFVTIAFSTIFSIVIGFIFVQYNHNSIYVSLGVSSIVYVFLVCIFRLVKFQELKSFSTIFLKPFSQLKRVKT